MDNIDLDKRVSDNLFYFVLQKNICCGYSSEALRRGTSNEYQRVFMEKQEKHFHTRKTFSVKERALPRAMVCSV